MAQTILVADDSPTIQRRASGILTNEGLEVVTVPNGVAAIRKLPTVKPQLILADVSMPGKDGYEVCEFVKNSPELSHVPVVLIFSELEPYQKDRGALVRADGQVKKPFDDNDLIATVTRLLAQSEESKVLPPISPLPNLTYESPHMPESAESSSEPEEQPEPNLISLSEGVAFTEFFGEADNSVLHEAELGSSPGQEPEIFQFDSSDGRTTAQKDLFVTGSSSEAGQETSGTATLSESNDIEGAAPAAQHWSDELNASGVSPEPIDLAGNVPVESSAQKSVGETASQFAEFDFASQQPVSGASIEFAETPTETLDTTAAATEVEPPRAVSTGGEVSAIEPEDSSHKPHTLRDASGMEVHFLDRSTEQPAPVSAAVPVSAAEPVAFSASSDPAMDASVKAKIAGPEVQLETEPISKSFGVEVEPPGFEEKAPAPSLVTESKLSEETIETPGYAEPGPLLGVEPALADSVADSKNAAEAGDETKAEMTAAFSVPTETPAAAPAPAETQFTSPLAVEAPENREEGHKQFDPEMIYSIVHKVVLRMSPPALMPEALEEVARRLAAEVTTELESEPC